MSILVRRLAVVAGTGALSFALSTAIAGAAVAAQPGVECEETRPGHAEDAPGSAFNEDGVAGRHYAGEQPGINDKNPHSISQYDVACVKIPG
jgi:hypothetical protein